MQVVDLTLHATWWCWHKLREFYPVMISSWWGLAFLAFTAFNMSWIVFWWVYYRFGMVWHWLVRVWVATVDFIVRLPEFWFRFWDLLHELWKWLCVVIPDIAEWCGRWVYNLLHQEYIWARDGNYLGLLQSFAVTAGFGFIAYCFFTIWRGRGPLRVLYDSVKYMFTEGNISLADIAPDRSEPNSPRERDRRRRLLNKD